MSADAGALSDEAKDDAAPTAAQLGRELFVFTAQKAGMADVDRARVQQVVLDISKDSQFFRNSMRQNDKVDAKIADMRAQLAALSGARRETLRRRVDGAVTQLEVARDLTRTVVVVDMDMFYAAVEMRDDPALRDVPLAVGGMSMISTTNYIARKFGVRAAMPGFIGKELCPALVFVRPNFDKYTAVAAQIRAVFAEYDPHFSAFSLDEAKLDISEYMEEHWGSYHKRRGAAAERSTRADLDGEQERADEDSDEDEGGDDDDDDGVVDERTDSDRIQVAGAIVAEIRHKIFLKTELTASAGIAANTMLAKIASDMNKPNGQFVLPFTRESVVSFIQSQPVRKIGGVGKVMEKILAAIGVTTGADLFARRVELFHLFSEKTAPWLLRTSLGIQEARESTGRKSFSRERTFQNLSDPVALEQMCSKVCGYLADDMREADAGCRTLTLKLKCSDFSVRSRSVSFAATLTTKDDLYSNAVAILRKELPLTLRLLGVRASALVSLSGTARVPGGANMSSKQRQLGMDRFATASSKPESLVAGDAVSHEQFDSGEVSAEDDSGSAARVGESSDVTVTVAASALPKSRKSKQREGASITSFITTIAKDATTDIVAAMLETNAAACDAPTNPSSDHARDDENEGDNARAGDVGEEAHFDESSFQPCPICGKMINVSNAIAINAHVDACITKQSQRVTGGRSSWSASSISSTSSRSGRSGKRDAPGSSSSQHHSYFSDTVSCFQPCPICGEMLNASSSKLVNTHIDACVLTPLSQPTPESPPQGEVGVVAASRTGFESDRVAALTEFGSSADIDSRCPICGVGIDTRDSAAVNAHVDACVAWEAKEGNCAGAGRPPAAGSSRGGPKTKRQRTGGGGGGGGGRRRGGQQHSIQSFFSTARGGGRGS